MVSLKFWWFLVSFLPFRPYDYMIHSEQSFPTYSDMGRIFHWRMWPCANFFHYEISLYAFRKDKKNRCIILVPPTAFSNPLIVSYYQEEDPDLCGFFSSSLFLSKISLYIKRKRAKKSVGGHFRRKMLHSGMGDIPPTTYYYLCGYFPNIFREESHKYVV